MLGRTRRGSDIEVRADIRVCLGVGDIEKNDGWFGRLIVEVGGLVKRYGYSIRRV